MQRNDLPLRALSIRQPWASAIFARTGGKTVENRNWPTNHRGLLYIHAAGRFDSTAPEFVWLVALSAEGTDNRRELPTSAIIGSVRVAACTDTYPYPTRWLQEEMPWHWWLRDRRRLDRIVRCVGHQSLWPIPDEIRRRL